MAMQTETPPAAPSAQVVGNAFVEQYYHILHHSPELVFRFYQDTSVMSRPGPDGVMTTVTTMKSINDKICSLDYKNFKAEIKTADAQDSYKDGVVVLVTGSLTGKDNLRRKFSQTFFLAPQDRGFYVHNDVFRYAEENEPDSSAGTVVGIDDIPSTSLNPDPEPAQVLDPPNPDQASSHEQVVENIQDVQGPVIEERQVSIDEDFVVEAESHLDENHISAVAESASSATQEDAPKKSYASILSSQSKKRPTKVYIPANTSRVAPTKTEKQAVDVATHASEPEASAPAAVFNSPKIDDLQNKAEGHSIYIRNLPLDVKADQLEAEFSKFGSIKQNGVQVRSNKLQGFCFGFVEFQDFSSMQSAIQASPITMGDRQAVVEIKRTTTRVVTGRGRFPNSRGGYRQDSYRVRGSFSVGPRGRSFGRNDGGIPNDGGRSFGRNDSFRGRGNFSGGRGGEGYQQGRGRGGRRGSPRPNAVST